MTRRLSETGLNSYMVPRRSLNWTVIGPYSLGMLGVASVRHTRGHTRRFLLATFSWHPRGAKQHQIVDALIVCIRAQPARTFLLS